MPEGAKVIELPVIDRLCGDCKNSSLSERGVYCHVFGEWIWNEREARDCEVWNEDA